MWISFAKNSFRRLFGAEEFRAARISRFKAEFRVDADNDDYQNLAAFIFRRLLASVKQHEVKFHHQTPVEWND